MFPGEKHDDDDDDHAADGDDDDDDAADGDEGAEVDTPGLIGFFFCLCTSHW